MKRIASWLVLGASVALGPLVVIAFLVAAFRGLDWPWYYCVPFVLAIVIWAFMTNWALGAFMDRERDKALEDNAGRS